MNVLGTVEIRDDRIPDAREAIDVYISVGWGHVSAYNMGAWQQGLGRQGYVVAAYDGPMLIGLARAVTDGFHDTYLTEIAVRPTYQKKGIGRNMMATILKRFGHTSLYVTSSAQVGDFFSKCGLKARPHMTVFSIAPTT